MSGLSDVGLTLRGVELQALADTPQVRKAGTYRYFSRWQWLLLRYRTRRQLLALDSEQLKDIGLSRADADQEGLKPFWRE